MMFLCLYISRWWHQTWDTAPYFTVVNQSEARISMEHGIKLLILAWDICFYHQSPHKSPHQITWWLRLLLMAWTNFNPSMDSNCIYPRVLNEITYPLTNFNNGCNYVSMLGFKLIHASKRAPGDMRFWVLQCSYCCEICQVSWELRHQSNFIAIGNLLTLATLTDFRKHQNLLHFLPFCKTELA